MLLLPQCREGMSVTITAAEVEHVATLARLGLDEQGKQTMTAELGRILQYIASLNEVNIEGVPPTSHALDPQANVLRDDRVVPGLSREDALAAAPAEKDGMFRVPRVVEV